MEKLKGKFEKVCINYHPCVDPDDKNSPALYLRQDLSKWSKEFFKKGETAFYTEPVNPDDKYGKLRLCEPKYQYYLKEPLTEKEFNEYFKE